MNINLTCRIDRSYFQNAKHYTLVSTPAVDSYSMPSSFRLTSDKDLGSKGDTIEVEVSLSGFVRGKEYVDRNTGEKKEYIDSNVFFNVISSKPHLSQVKIQKQS